MKREEAYQKGYSYTGICDLRDISGFNARNAELKAKGYKTVIVHESVSQYSRSSAGMKYRSLYVEKKYFEDQRKESLVAMLAKIESRKAEALKAYEAEIAKIEKEANDMAAELERLTAK